MQPSRFLVSTFGAAIVVLAGCGASGAQAAADKQFDALHTEIGKMQADQDRLNERVSGLESSRARGTTGGSDRPPLSVVVLQPDAPEPTAAEDPDAQPDDDAAPRPTVRAAGNGGKGKKAKGDPTGKGEVRRDATKEYDDALSLVKKKQYERAIDAFTGFLVRNPDHANADNAMFWMGEAYLGHNEPGRAVEQWEALLARFPQGNKAPDALLKIALTQKSAGETDKAKATLARLRSKFPSSDAAKRAPKE